MHHYFRFADEYTGNDEAARREEVNDDIKSRRDDAYAHLKRFARLAEQKMQRKGPFCPAPQPCIIVCRLSDQEIAQGCIAAMGDMFMERAVWQTKS